MKNALYPRMIVLMILVLAMAVGSGCKKSADNPTTVTLLSEAAYDGYGQPGGFSTATTYAVIGDFYNNNQCRGWVSFNLSGIPAGTAIDSAVLSIFQLAENYSESYNLGPVLVDHVFFGINIINAYDIGALSSVNGSLATAFSSGFKDINVTAEVQNDIDQNRSMAQFRFYHTIPTNNDGNNNYDQWAMSDSPTNQPKLVVIYH